MFIWLAISCVSVSKVIVVKSQFNLILKVNLTQTSETPPRPTLLGEKIASKWNGYNFYANFSTCSVLISWFLNRVLKRDGFLNFKTVFRNRYKFSRRRRVTEHESQIFSASFENCKKLCSFF